MSQACMVTMITALLISVCIYQGVQFILSVQQTSHYYLHAGSSKLQTVISSHGQSFELPSCEMSVSTLV